MLLRWIEDMNRALDHECYFAALAIALMLPDICGMAKYHSKGKARYIDWFDEYVGRYEKSPGDDTMPYLSGEVVYSLRCSFLHQGTPNIQKEDIKNEEICKIDFFRLLIEKKNSFDIYSDSASISRFIINGNEIGSTFKRYEVNVRRLCLVLSACAMGYYKEFPEQFDFFNYDVVDVDNRNDNYLERWDKKLS
ncbi:MAG: hypothetical protein IKI03_05430 [Clostridia bacterium]|nr:hypothetical protein [Clostridia bacterium]